MRRRSGDDGAATPPPVAVIYDPRVRSAIYQLALVLALAWLGYQFALNAMANLGGVYFNLAKLDLALPLLKDAMEKGKGDIVAIAPAMAEFSPAFAYKNYGVPYHPGALRFFKERNLSPRPLE